MRMAKSSRQDRELPMFLKNSTASCMMKVNLMKQKWNPTKMRLKMMRERRMKFLKSRRMNCRMQSKGSRKAKQQTAMESDPKTSKHATKKRKKWWDRSSTKSQSKMNLILRHGEEWEWKWYIKRGDVENVGNYRPICSLPDLYKLFTTVLCSRLYPRLDQTKVEDQAGSRSSYQTTDHFATYRMIGQKCHEWWNKMSAADNRRRKGVRLHHAQINLGRPQILQHRTWLHPLLEEFKQRPESHSTDWRRKRHVWDQERNQTGWSTVKLALQHGSAESIGRRHSALAKEKRCGNTLERQRSRLPHKHENCWRRAPFCILNRTAPKCYANSSEVQKKWDSESIEERRKFSATKVEILTREESTKYLGQMITFQQQETTETRNCIRAAWATFHKYGQELTSRSYMLRHRLRLFDAVVSPTMNYASGTRTVTKKHERMIQSTQRKMLRRIIQTKIRYKKTL